MSEKEKVTIIDCPNCGKTTSDIGENCPYCGAGLHPDNDMEEELVKTNNQVLFHLNNKKLLFSIFIILISVIVIISIGLGYGQVKMNHLQERIASLELDNSDYENEYNDLESRYDQLTEKYNSNKKSLDEIKKGNEALTAELKNYQDQQATINDLNAKLTEIQSQYDALEADRNNLSAQLDAKKAAQEQAAKEQATQRANETAGTVYWVSGGSVYHSTPNCPTLKRSSNIQSGSIAGSGKGRACKVCN